MDSPLSSPPLEGGDHTPPRVTGRRAAGTHNRRSYVSGPHKVEEERLRKRAGAAVARIPASGNALAADLNVHHTTITHRKEGIGPLALLLTEVDAWERAGRDTTPVLEAVIATQLEARATRVGGESISTRKLAIAEQALDGEEDVAQCQYLDRQPGAAKLWRDRLISLTTLHHRLIFALWREEPA